MDKKIKVILFGNEQECRATTETLKALELLSEHSHEYFHVDDLEEFDKKLVDWEPTLLVVLADGAEGMECVYRSRERFPSLPVFWFSDDQGFGIQSYRLGCAYFSTKPITPDKMNHGFHRCNSFGISYGTT